MKNDKGKTTVILAYCGGDGRHPYEQGVYKGANGLVAILNRGRLPERLPELGACIPNALQSLNPAVYLKRVDRVYIYAGSWEIQDALDLAKQLKDQGKEVRVEATYTREHPIPAGLQKCRIPITWRDARKCKGTELERTVERLLGKK